jgi:hypothetical protein
MSDQVFHYFPYLDEYLRRMIWKFYFTAPRIHVIHEPTAPVFDPEVIHLTCTSFDAESNIPVPSYLHWDIDRESRQVAQGLKPKRERIENFLKPVNAGSIIFDEWPVEPTTPPENPVRKVAPVDIDWDNDWLYFYSPRSSFSFASLRVREDWVAKISKLAVCEPMETVSSIRDRRSPDQPRNPEAATEYRIPPGRTIELLCRLKGLRELHVVVSTDNMPAIARSDPNGEEGKWCKHLRRNSVGFVSWDDYRTVNNRVEARRYGLGSPTMLWAFQFYETVSKTQPELGFIVNSAVDVDGWQLEDGSYHRRLRTELPALPEPILVDGEEFTIEITEPS